MEINKYLLEFLGTAIFLYVILATGNALAIGATLALLTLVGISLGGVGHYNPAVSIIMASAKKIPINDLVPIVILQIFGGLIALEIYKRVRL
jgi:glycerol uptake facilitator-like aquaporin